MSHLTQSELPTALPTSPPCLHALPLWQIVVLAALSLWLYGPTLIHLIRQWWQDPNFSHGFFVPAFSAFVVWQGRTRLAQIPMRPSWTGAGILPIALAVLVIGQTGAELFLARFSVILLLSSLIVLFLGWNHLRALLFPLPFLVLMIPIPTIVFNQITFPLQLLASWLSAVASVPIAVVANGSRIVGTGLLVQYWDPDKAEGFFHTFSGWLIFVVSLVMLYVLHRVLRMMWRETEGSGLKGQYRNGR